MSAILDFGISTPTMHRKNGGNSFEQPDRSSIGYWASVRLFKGISPILEWSITHKRPLCVIFDVKRSVMGNRLLDALREGTGNEGFLKGHFRRGRNRLIPQATQLRMFLFDIFFIFPFFNFH